MNRRFLLIAMLAAVVLGAAVAAYVYLDKNNSSIPPDAKSLLESLPPAAPTDTSAAIEEWTQKQAIGRYDTLQRAGTAMLGRWAGGIREACMASAPISSIPDERSWKQPIIVHQCFDGVPVFRIELED